VWHYDEDFLSGRASSPNKPASPGSPELAGDAPSSFVMLNLSSGRQDADSREWGMLERPPGSPGPKAAGTPSAEEVEEEEEAAPEILRPGEKSPGWGRGSPAPAQVSSAGVSKGDRLEPSGGCPPGGNTAPVTPTSPAEALAEGVLTQVRRGSPPRSPKHVAHTVHVHAMRDVCHIIHDNTDGIQHCAPRAKTPASVRVLAI